MYKLRVYIIGGRYEGNLDHEEHFNTFEEADKRWKELFDVRNLGLNPTVWKEVSPKESAWIDESGRAWKRLPGY